MGNTNIPQAGAAHVKNGRETLSGINQLTDEQQKRLREQSGVSAEATDPAAADANMAERALDPDRSGAKTK